VVIVATGGAGLVPAVPGIELPWADGVRDWLTRRCSVGTRSSRSGAPAAPGSPPWTPCLARAPA